MLVSELALFLTQALFCVNLCLVVFSSPALALNGNTLRFIAAFHACFSLC